MLATTVLGEVCGGGHGGRPPSFWLFHDSVYDSIRSVGGQGASRCRSQEDRRKRHKGGIKEQGQNEGERERYNERSCARVVRVARRQWVEEVPESKGWKERLRVGVGRPTTGVSRIMTESDEEHKSDVSHHGD